MRRFDFEDEDPDREEVERFLDADSQEYLITPEEYKNILEEEISLYDAKFRDTIYKLKYKVLLRSLDLLKGSFFWRFYSLNTKLNHIELVYKKMVNLLDLYDGK